MNSRTGKFENQPPFETICFYRCKNSCQRLFVLSERHHQGNTIHGKYIMAGTAGYAAAQVEAKTSRRHYGHKTSIDTDLTQGDSSCNPKYGLLLSL